MKKELLSYRSLVCKNLLFFLVFLNFNASAQESNLIVSTTLQKVIPNNYESTPGNLTFSGPFTTSQRIYQLLIAESELTELVNKTLVGIAFRLPTSATSAYPTSDASANNYDIYLSGCVNPADRSLTFVNNVVGVQTQVRSGSLLIPANSLTSGNSPNEFSFTINFTNNYLYTGGNLLIEIRHDGFTGSSRSIDAAGTSTSGYGTLYSACWQGTYSNPTSGSQGNFGIVNIVTNEQLKNNEFNSSFVEIYPNPVRDGLNFEQISGLKSIKIYSIIGQLLLNKKGDENLNYIDLSWLNNGTYLLQFETENGSVTKKIIKN